jgi:hypothetical protein
MPDIYDNVVADDRLEGFAAEGSVQFINDKGEPTGDGRLLVRGRLENEECESCRRNSPRLMAETQGYMIGGTTTSVKNVTCLDCLVQDEYIGNISLFG